MFLARKTEIFPTPNQAEYIERLFSARRGIWNKLHELYKDNPKEAVSEYKTCKVISEVLLWTGEYSSRLLRGVCVSYAEAWKSYFKKIKGAPNFKSKKEQKQSVKFIDSPIVCVNGVFKIPSSPKEFGKIKLSEDFSSMGPCKELTISKRNNRFYVSFLFQTSKIIESKEGSIGLDWGCKDFLTGSDGRKVNLPPKVVKIRRA